MQQETNAVSKVILTYWLILWTVWNWNIKKIKNSVSVRGLSIRSENTFCIMLIYSLYSCVSWYEILNTSDGLISSNYWPVMTVVMELFLLELLTDVGDIRINIYLVFNLHLLGKLSPRVMRTRMRGLWSKLILQTFTDFSLLQRPVWGDNLDMSCPQQLIRQSFKVTTHHCDLCFPLLFYLRLSPFIINPFFS